MERYYETFAKQSTLEGTACGIVGGGKIIFYLTDQYRNVTTLDKINTRSARWQEEDKDDPMHW